MGFDLGRMFRRDGRPAALRDGFNRWRRRKRLGLEPKKRAITRPILMDDMANRVIKLLAGNKGKKLTREEIAARVADNMHLAALAISEELANASRDDEGEPLISLGDRMAAFKQLREWEMAQARIGKLDPKDKDKGGNPSAIEAYQNELKENQAKHAAGEAERVTAEGQRDKRHDNPGRPPGQSLKKKQEKVLAQQKRLREKEDAARAEVAPPEVKPETREM